MSSKCCALVWQQHRAWSSTSLQSVPLSLSSCCTSCGPVSPGNASPPSLPSSLLPTRPPLLSGPLSPLCLLPLYLSAGMKGSVRERAPLCIHLRVFLCTWLCLRKCVFVVWLKFCWLVQASCVRAPIESEQVGPGDYSPANHSFLRLTDWVTPGAPEIQTAHC